MAKIYERKEIIVYAHWLGMTSPAKMGKMVVTEGKGKEVFSFEYDNGWIKSGITHMLDPDMQLYPGTYYPRNEKPNFGLFMDSCPDRWGRTLMQRREAAMARKEGRTARQLLESDYLLGVFDGHRMGALRFKTEEKGSFMNDNKKMASPPWTSLRELEEVSLKFESDNISDPEYLQWVNMLIVPGSSLGGARPKASVLDSEGGLWIAKFPSRMDDKDIGAWEMVVNQLAKKAGVNAAHGMVERYNSRYHTYLTKRFDRTIHGERIHFASAMTSLGYTDGERSAGASYLELAEFLTRHGVSVEQDLEELWRRIVFNISVKNTDDHLRNHGFLLTNAGWRLSPAFDINPNEYGNGLHLNISEKDNALSIDLALEVAEYFRLTPIKANRIIKQVKNALSTWKEIAIKYKIPKAEQGRMAQAFSI
jgi:serine/threonine-protein kinase HipA